jgi:integrase
VAGAADGEAAVAKDLNHRAGSGMRKIKGVYRRKGTAYIRYQDETGQLVRESTQQRSLNVAETILAQRKSEVAMRRNFPRRAYEDVCFGDLIDYWWDLHGRQTRSRFEYRLPRLRTGFASRQAREITSAKVEEFLDQLEQQGFAASSVNQHRTILNSVFNFAIKREKYDRNPVSAVAQRKEPPGRDRFPTPEEFGRLAEECRADPQLYAFVWLAATTGARKGEILPRTWKEVDLEGAAPHVYVPRSKNGCPKRLPLAAEVVQALKKLPSYGHDAYLFPSRTRQRAFHRQACRSEGNPHSRSAPHGDHNPLSRRHPRSHHS